MGVKSMDFGIPQTKVQISAAPSTNWGALGKKKKKITSQGLWPHL